jgi:hypothetical protein
LGHRWFHNQLGFLWERHCLPPVSLIPWTSCIFLKIWNSYYPSKSVDYQNSPSLSVDRLGGFLKDLNNGPLRKHCKWNEQLRPFSRSFTPKSGHAVWWVWTVGSDLYPILP